MNNNFNFSKPTNNVKKNNNKNKVSRNFNYDNIELENKLLRTDWITNEAYEWEDLIKNLEYVFFLIKSLFVIFSIFYIFNWDNNLIPNFVIWLENIQLKTMFLVFIKIFYVLGLWIFIYSWIKEVIWIFILLMLWVTLLWLNNWILSKNYFNIWLSLPAIGILYFIIEISIND